MLQQAPRTQAKRLPAWLHKLWMGLVVIMMITVNAMQGLTLQAHSASVSTSVRDQRIVMYVMDNAGYTMTEEHAALANQVNYSFALIRNGKASGSHWQSIKDMSQWLKRHPEIDGVLSVGGWGADGFSQACATEEGRITLANSMLALMDQHGFIGLDIDWEYPGSSAAGIASSSEDVDNWHSLLALLRTGLDERTAQTGRRHILSVAIGAGNDELMKLDGEMLDQLVDQVMLMSYDLTNYEKTTAHHAGLYPAGDQKNSVASAVQLLLQKGIDHDKLLMGIPAYGRMWRQVSGEGNGLGQKAATSGNKTLTYAQVTDLINNGYTCYYDETAQAAWYYDGENFVSGEHVRSLLAKAAYVMEHDLAGVGVWCWNHDEEHRVIKTLLSGFET